MTMWKEIEAMLHEKPERLVVARFVLEHGLRVSGEKVYCGKVEIPAKKIADALGVDRRTVGRTARMLHENPRLKDIFTNMQPTFSLKGIAKFLGFGVIEIFVQDASKPGILAACAKVIAEEDISIRQAFADDPDLSPEVKLTIITESPVPGSVYEKLHKLAFVEHVSIY
jgi:hypothetical protein